jgi:hypothetical protein
MRTSPSILSSPASLAIVASVCGCAATKPYQTTFDVPTLALREKNDIAMQGVQVGLAPVTRENEANYPQLARPMKWHEPDPGAPHVTGAEGRAVPSGQTVERSGIVELTPLPAFYIGIANRTGSTLSLSSMKIEVEDGARRPYSVVLSAEALRQRLFGDLTGANPFIAGNRALMDNLMQQIANLPILNPGLSIPNGEVWRGYLVLDVNTRSAKEYYSLMKSIQGFTVRLKDVPTGAGRSDFEFVVDKTDRPTALTCPGDVSDPSPEKCKVAQAAAPASGEPSKAPR